MFCLLFILSWWSISSEIPCRSSQRAHRYPHVKKFVAQSLRTIACTLQYPRTLCPWFPETKQHRGKTVSSHPAWLASDPEKQQAREMKWHLTPTISQETDLGKAGLKKFHIKKDGASLRLLYDRATVIQANIIHGGKILACIFSCQDMLGILKKLQVLVIPPKGQNRRHTECIWCMFHTSWHTSKGCS